ncbi:ATP-binding protein [Microbacterium esteraromaticum]|uniref:ATP-dependent nuclease n=1 Tax=Microbacterium esteraromaticum TaxID=57043 RepID=UPI0030A3EC84
MTDNFKTLQAFVDRGLAEPFIRSIRFPRFKNLFPGSVIEFTYPITALIGPNGTNKSTILRALQGSPRGHDIGDHWFDTPLDPIGPERSDPHRFIHSYRAPSGATAEVIQARVGKTTRGPDYFETSAPRRRDGMSAMPEPAHPEDAGVRNKTRWRPIAKEVVYLDFRQEIPAYDILMYFNWRKKKNEPEQKKRKIRTRAPHVNQALSGLQSKHELYRANRILEPADELTSDELRGVSLILGRDYTSIRIVKHDFFDVEGYTASLSADGLKYSEAYAGSGEFAAIMLVRAISRAQPRSLILLDEPETSLHPGAQRELMAFIASECVRNKHQVVLATHAPAIVVDLPSEARKLLDLDPVSGRVRVAAQSATADQSFSRIGGRFQARTILVEDELARAFVLRACRLRGDDFLKSVSILPVAGGAEALVRRVVAVQAPLGADCIVLFDGDCRLPTPLRASSEVTDTQLQAELDPMGLTSDVLLRNGGNGDQTEHLARVRRNALEWVLTHVDYLPGTGNPEALLLGALGISDLSNAEAKETWRSRTRSSLNLLESEVETSAQILDEQIRTLAGLNDAEPVLVEILETLDRVMAKAGMAGSVEGARSS